MADVYTPTKDIQGAFIPRSAGVESPAVYVPTPLNPQTTLPSTSTSALMSTPKMEDQTTRQKYGGLDSYSPSNPGIRIVKRKPKPEASPIATPTAIYQGKRRVTTDGEDAGLAALKMKPSKGIIKSLVHNPLQRPYRRIVFADTRGLPLVHIKEIERIAAIHSNYSDFRCSERNEGAAFGCDHQEEDVEWGLLQVRRAKPVRTTMSETGLREEKRIADSGIMTGAMFGVQLLEDVSELNQLAATDMTNSRPTLIPTVSVPSEPTTLAALRELPLPGRSRTAAVKNHDQMVAQYQQNQYQQHYTAQSTTGNMYQGTMNSTPNPPVIQQVFQETDQVDNYYTATTSLPQEEEVEKSPPNRFELPANLKEMLAQLKKKGFMSSDDSAAPSSTNTQMPSSTDSLSSAMHAAQQMIEQQGSTNTYSCEETAQDYPMDGYVATFATPEMMAQERIQNSRNSEGWTQSGWKIQEPCVYFVNRPGGCNRGDQCRFVHDEEMRHQKMADLPPRGNYHYHREHDDRGYRGEHRRGRAGFRGGFNRNNHLDRDFRDHRGLPTRYNIEGNEGPGGFRGGRFNKRGYGYGGNHGVQRFDKKGGDFGDYHGYHGSQQQQLHDGHQNSHGHLNGNQADESPDQNGVPSQKRARISRFDQREDDGCFGGGVPGDIDHRQQNQQQRKNRFDDLPRRQFRSRFDQALGDQDDRAPNYSA